jgi:hypothetical protein
MNTLSIGDAGSMILGAGLTQITTNLNIALLLIGVGAGLKVVVAVLQKWGFEVSSYPQG